MKNINELIYKVKEKHHHLMINDDHVLVLTKKGSSLCKRNVIDMITIKPYNDIEIQCPRYAGETLRSAAAKLNNILEVCV